MNIVILGAGALGQWIGSKLIGGGHEVTFIARPPYYEALQDKLTIIEGDAQKTANDLKVYKSLDDMPPVYRKFDLIVLTVKSYNTTEVIESVMRCTSPATPLITFQNGIGNEEAISNVLQRDRIYSGACTVAVYSPAPGTIVAATGGGVAIAPTERNQNPYVIAEPFTNSEFKTRVLPDYKIMKWSKLLLNILGNATSAILDMPPEKILERPDIFKIEIEAFKEALSVIINSKMRIVSLPGYNVPVMASLLVWLPSFIVKPVLCKKIAKARGDKMPSLHVDLARGKGKSEVDYLNGVVVKAAKEIGYAAPINDLITKTLKGIVEGQIPWDKYRKKPEVFASMFPILHQ